jgi:hypothetical protein
MQEALVIMMILMPTTTGLIGAPRVFHQVAMNLLARDSIQQAPLVSQLNKYHHFDIFLFDSPIYEP